VIVILSEIIVTLSDAIVTLSEAKGSVVNGEATSCA
jgi:hypothetical protein